MTNGGEAGGMNRRVGELEAEVQSLRLRVAALEKVAGVATSPSVHTMAAPAPAGVPVAPQPTPATPPASSTVPPPLPPMVRQPVSSPMSPPPVRVAAFTPVPPAIEPRIPPASEPSPVRDFLHAMHLLPPSGGGSGEVQLLGWWTTRIGALLGVLGVVSFGIYVSLSSAPWVKLAELAAASMGVALFGAWIGRRAARFGSVVLGAGLALIFFTAFAAYAIPAVKVIDDVLIAALVQAAAVALVYGVAVRRDSSTVATMATLLGYVSAFFALSEDFSGFAVVASLALAAVTVVFRRWRGWAIPLGIAAVLAHVVYAVIAETIWSTELGAHSPLFAYSILGAGSGVIFLSLVLEGAGEGGVFSRAQRWIQSLNGSFAALAGFVAMRHVLIESHHSWYFFGAAVVFAGAALWVWRVARADALFSVFAVKTATLLALGVMTEWEARTRWVALLVQAFVLLAAARGSKRVSIFVTTAFVWLVSLMFFSEDIHRLHGRLISGSGLAVVFYVVAGAVLLTLLPRWWPAGQGGQTRLTRLLVALAAAAPVALACPLAMVEAWGPAALALLCVVFLGTARALRSGIPLFAGAVALLLGHLALQDYDEFGHQTSWLWAGAALLCVVSIACGWRSAEIEAPCREPKRAAWGTLGCVLQAFALAALFGGLFQSTPVHMAVGLAAAIAAVVAWFGALNVRPASIGAGVLGLFVAVLLVPAHRGDWLEDAGPKLWLWLAAACAPAILAALGQETGGVRERLERSRTFVALATLVVLAGINLVWLAAASQFGAIGGAWSFVAAAAVYFAVGQVRGMTAGFAAASGLLALAMAEIVAAIGDDRWPPAQNAWGALIAAFAAGIAFAATPVVAIQRATWLGGNWPTVWRISHAALAAMFIALIAVQGDVAWSSYGSIVLALGGIALFVLGMFCRARSHRVAGLLALALCVARVFIVDIQSALYRIGAFIVLGVVFLGVGYLYQRFRHRIEGGSPAADENAETTP